MKVDRTPSGQLALDLQRALVGSDTAPIQRLIRLREVQHRVGLSRSSIYRFMAEGTFPKPVHLGARSVAWVEHEIDAWLQSRSR